MAMVLENIFLIIIEDSCSWQRNSTNNQKPVYWPQAGCWSTDKFLLHHLSEVQDDLPIGESLWVIVNPDRASLDAVSSRILKVLPRAKVNWCAVHFRAGRTKGSQDWKGKSSSAPAATHGKIVNGAVDDATNRLSTYN